MVVNEHYNFKYYQQKDFEKLLLISNEFAYYLNNNAMKKKTFDKVQFDKDERKFLKQNSKDKNYRYYVCEFKDEFIGFTFFGRQDNNKSEGFVGELYVKPKFRKKGIATNLLNEATKWIKQQQCDIIEIDVNTRDKNAILLYEKFGFKRQTFHFVTYKKKI